MLPSDKRAWIFNILLNAACGIRFIDLHDENEESLALSQEMRDIVEGRRSLPIDEVGMLAPLVTEWQRWDEAVRRTGDVDDGQAPKAWDAEVEARFPNLPEFVNEESDPAEGPTVPGVRYLDGRDVAF